MYLNLSKKLIVASNSPRRQEIMKAAGFKFEVIVRPTNEEFASSMALEEVPVFLAKQKLKEFETDKKDEIVLCADTVVIANNVILNKPIDKAEAFQMLSSLSGRTHRVVSGVAASIEGEVVTFSDVADVTFKELEDQEIEFYLEACAPYDKAGAYGIQEFMGMVGIKELKGSYYTVMGLPIHKVYEVLRPWINY